jgi:exoribonuclease R
VKAIKAAQTMLKDIEEIRKAARIRAQRRWNNYAVEKSFKEARAKAAEDAAKEPKAIEPGDVLEREKLITEETTKFERQFIKDLREMLEGHTERNRIQYLAFLEHRNKLLLMEKLRRLRAQYGE